MSVPVICIDGPSGSGKGTLARNLAAHLNFLYLDSGALYRVLAVLSQRADIDLAQLDKADPKQMTIYIDRLVEIAGHIDVQFVDNQVLLNGEDLSPEVRLETTAGLASELAAFPEIREALVESQRQYAQPPGLVADGRDMGTVIFPNAPLKIFLIASAEERAKRRLNQLEQLQKNRVINLAENEPNQLINKDLNHEGRGASLRALVKDIEARDGRDMNRETSPLRPAADAIEIDCTSLSIDDVLSKVVSLWEKIVSNTLI